MITVVLAVLVVIVATLAVLAGASVRVLREYERGVVFRLGRLINQKGPGLTLLIPAVDRLVRVSLRTVTLRIPHQEVITRDNVPVKVAAVVYFRVIDPTRSVVEVEDHVNATLQIAQTTLRSVLGKAELDTLLSERESLNESLQQIIDEHTEPWGIKVSVVEIKDVEIPDRMQSAIARQAEAERTRRAKVINSEGEYQAAAKLAKRPRSSSPTRSRCSCATCRRSRRSAPTRARRSSSRCRSTCCVRCWTRAPATARRPSPSPSSLRFPRRERKAPRLEPTTEVRPGRDT